MVASDSIQCKHASGDRVYRNHNAVVVGRSPRAEQHFFNIINHFIPLCPKQISFCGMISIDKGLVPVKGDYL
jgi:hypothetical protein